MRLSTLLLKSNLNPLESAGDAEVTSLVMDSREAKPGSLFVCMPGGSFDSQSFIGAASEKGAVAAIVFDSGGSESAIDAQIPYVRFASDRIGYNEAIWRLCNSFFDRPTHNMKVIGVTGTNGKSTTAWMLRDMMAALGVRTGYIGTLGVQLPETNRELANTTPFAVELYNLLDQARTQKTEALAMEVSSHALAERRADGIEFDAGIFTNLTQDHLDFHQSMQSYAAAKHRLFTDLPLQSDKRFVGVFNVDDPIGRRWAVEQNGPSLTYGFDEKADLVGRAIAIEVDHIRMELDYGRTVAVDVHVGGHFNLFNCLSAVAGMLALGYSLEQVTAAIASVRPVPGRFEAVRNSKGIGVLVDYAHTPDALEKLLESVRELDPKRIITVFGCGGDRDSTKRSVMGKTASQLSDITIVTSDNPRTEDPIEIMNEIQSGIQAGSNSLSIVDRREAVAQAVKMANPGDVVVIAGKGHENYQIVGRTKLSMDDRELAREALN